MSIEQNNISRKHYVALAIIITVYVVVFSTISCLRQYQFITQTWDMGVFEQTFWNSIHGKLMQNNLEEAPNHLGVHMSPFLVLLVPGYYIFPSAYYLLIIQTIALGLGAWPLYLLARRILKKHWLALLLAAGYLVYPWMHWINIFDFHEEPFLIPFIIAAVYCIEMKYWWRTIIFLGLAALTKENAILVVAVAGVYIFFSQPLKPLFTKQRALGLVVTLVSILYFIVAIKIIMPAFGGGLLRIDRYAAFGATPAAVITTIFTNPGLVAQTMFTPEKLYYLLWLFLPVAFLPWLSWRGILLLIPGLVQNLLASFGFQFSHFYQYDTPLIPGIAIGMVYGLAFSMRVLPRIQKYIPPALVICLVISFALKSPIKPIAFPKQLFTGSQKWDAYRSLVALVPPYVSVAANTNIVPHLAHREYIAMLGAERRQPDVIVIDGTDPFGFSDEAAFRSYIENYAKTGEYFASAVDDHRFILYRKDLKLNAK